MDTKKEDCNEGYAF